MDDHSGTSTAQPSAYILGDITGLGSTREQDQQALRRVYEHLEPGERLVLDNEVLYPDATNWGLWPSGGRDALPQPRQAPGVRRLESDGDEYALQSRLLSFDPVRQQEAWETTHTTGETGRSSPRRATCSPAASTSAVSSC